MFDLSRFILAHEGNYELALRELCAGHKKSHWIWYIFPQQGHLGVSAQSKYYGISSMKEAKAYMAHPVLGSRYLECVDALLEHRHRPIVETMGTNLDARKLLSSLTLMSNACGKRTIREAISALYSDSDWEEEQRLVAKC
jgi:uncharacterized protein (DUF1810 family)